MPVHGPHAQEQLPRDLAVCPAGSDELNDLELAGGEPRNAGPLSVARPASDRTSELAQLPGGLVSVVDRPAGGQLGMCYLEVGDCLLPIDGGEGPCRPGSVLVPRR